LPLPGSLNLLADALFAASVKSHQKHHGEIDHETTAAAHGSARSIDKVTFFKNNSYSRLFNKGYSLISLKS
jgi:hypothetical protein